MFHHYVVSQIKSISILFHPVCTINIIIYVNKETEINEKTAYFLIVRVFCMATIILHKLVLTSSL